MAEDSSMHVPVTVEDVQEYLGVGEVVVDHEVSRSGRRSGRSLAHLEHIW